MDGVHNGDNVHDELRFLSQSENRVEILSILQERETDRYTIEERVNASRRTVIRTLDALIDQGYVTENDGEYSHTFLGAAIYRSYREFASNVSVIQELRPFFTHLDADVCPVEPQSFVDAELLVATEGSPYALLDRTLAIRQSAGEIRELAPIVERKSVAQLAERLRNDDTVSVEVVLSKQALEAGVTHPEYRDDHETVARSDRVELRVAPELPLLLCIADGTVAIGVRKNEKPHALLVSENDRVIEWAERTFERYRRRSEQFTLQK